ncbi:hypothetical protein BG011_006276 [Mortierella polycephala]|uniref:Uncharacterized protein n=1 Tax=Mortierella polycephala TaxID=41804 RepID=A0A9P6U8Y2_9FUNG|nr:hypothetical protein BG011_006276 [Mortierella polycephala]
MSKVSLTSEISVISTPSTITPSGGSTPPATPFGTIESPDTEENSGVGVSPSPLRWPLNEDEIAPVFQLDSCLESIAARRVQRHISMDCGGPLRSSSSVLVKAGNDGTKRYKDSGRTMLQDCIIEARRYCPHTNLNIDGIDCGLDTGVNHNTLQDATTPAYGLERDIAQPLDIATKPGRKPSRIIHKLMKISNAVKKSWREIWTEDSHTAGRSPVNRVPLDTTTAKNPFFQVKSGVRFQDIVPEKPVVFPYPSQIRYTSRYGTELAWEDSAVVQQSRLSNREAAQYRERENRIILKRLKSKGRFRRRPNIILPWTEGRITEPVEVIRIRRLHRNSTQKTSPSGNTDGATRETLLETINRQHRTGTQEWTVTGISPKPFQGSIGANDASRVNRSIRVAVSDSRNELVSRKSLRRMISTRFHGKQAKRHDTRSRQKSSFTAQLEEYERKKMALKQHVIEESLAEEPLFARNLAAALQQSIALCGDGIVPPPPPILTCAPCASPTLIPRCNTPVSDTSLQNPSPIPLSAKAIRTYLEPSRPLLHLEDPGRIALHGRLRSGSNCDKANDRASVTNSPFQDFNRSSRSSAYSSTSVSSHHSTASSIANSIYSTLSEDWIRPLYFTKPKSRRYPLSLQSTIREPPPHVNLAVHMTSKAVSNFKFTQQHQLALRDRGLKDIDGSAIQFSEDDGLYDVDYWMVFNPIEGELVPRLEDAAKAFEGRCKTAMPQSVDELGFLEYGDQDLEDAGESDGATGDATALHICCDENGSCAQSHSGRYRTMDLRSRAPGSAQRPVVDVNDLSAMIASGIKPTDPHPDPGGFYNTHYEYFQTHDCFRDTDAVVDTEVEMKSVPESKSIGHGLVHESDQRMSPKSKFSTKETYKSLQAYFKGSRDGQQSNVNVVQEINIIKFMTPGMNSPREDCDGADGMPGWISRIHGGSQRIGQFDRDWLDAMPLPRTRRVRDL